MRVRSCGIPDVPVGVRASSWHEDVSGASWPLRGLRAARTLNKLEELIVKKADVQIGRVYIVKVSGRRCPVRLDRDYVSSYSGRTHWIGTNLFTRREVTIESAARLRCEVVRNARGAWERVQ